MIASCASSNKCFTCGKIGHLAAVCRFEKQFQGSRKPSQSWKPQRPVSKWKESNAWIESTEQPSNICTPNIHSGQRNLSMFTTGREAGE